MAKTLSDRTLKLKRAKTKNGQKITPLPKEIDPNSELSNQIGELAKAIKNISQDNNKYVLDITAKLLDKLENIGLPQASAPWDSIKSTVTERDSRGWIKKVKTIKGQDTFITTVIKRNKNDRIMETETVKVKNA